MGGELGEGDSRRERGETAVWMLNKEIKSIILKVYSFLAEAPSSGPSTV